ncbi:coiled-coil and C2 domain-containing protein 1-like isoform X2 [Chrysoperla carnea]|uniref:coiled-coil and C2 domain-containing protein 1-like isoform X2 n=1 Tax=Chrysoperla carnea TaxID=189513 RepID=UPI001D0990E0|nr:coiled-coil and C2 domain-containing protein 1-like isoform X2 [Chrysoperla carnea]
MGNCLTAMFGRKKEEKPRRPASKSKNLSQFGLFNIPDDFQPMDNEPTDSEDDDFEAELAAITSGNGPKKPQRQKPKPNLVSPDALDQLVSASLRDIPSDEEVNSDDENDPTLLSELHELAGVPPVVESPPNVDDPGDGDISQLLQNRLKMYETAEDNAKKAGESSRARRLGRGIKTLKDLIKNVNAGRNIDQADIPPEVAITVHKKPDPEPAVEPSPETNVPVKPPTIDLPAAPVISPEDNSNIDMLNERKKQYKLAALKAKKENDNVTALNYIKIAKQFDVIIEAIQNGQEVDLSNMPGPPQEKQNIPMKEESETQKSPQADTVISPDPGVSVSEETEEDAPAPALITASSVAEALQQRLEIYKGEEQKAKEAGNSSKARRMGRIVKQFQDAIRLNNAGKPIPIDELPTPPGFAPIPVPGGAPSEPPPQLKPAPAPPRPAPAPPRPTSEPATEEGTATQPPTPPKRGTVRKSGNQSSTTHNERQLEVLLAKQKEFKLAALNAKKNGEIMQAKEYLKMAKGMDALIEAATCGLPVDMSTIPIPATARSELEDGFDFVMTAECNDDDSEMTDILGRMEKQLLKQLSLCLSTRDHLKAIGDVAGLNRFENLALSVTRDLDMIRVLRRSGDNPKPPKFHYETKNFSVVKCNTDLNDDELELIIVRGINYKCPNPTDIDTYVKFEFPFPQEDPPKDRTSTVKDTNNPEYNASFKLPIQRNARVCQRVFKRQGVKFEVYSRGGFLRSDTLLGTVTVKLQQLESKVEIHDSFDLLEGRKAVGGKLEVRLRIRDPLQTRQIEEMTEKWLIIDSS